MNRSVSKLVSLMLTAGLLLAGLVSATHVHRHTPHEGSEQSVATYDCGCPIPHAPSDQPAEGNLPSHDDCSICKLLASFSADVQNPVELEFDSIIRFFEMAEIEAVTSEPLRRYLGRAPPVFA